MKIKGVEMELIRSNRRSLAIEVKSGGRVIVRAPRFLDKNKITAFVNSRYEWIITAIERSKKRDERLNLTNEQIDFLRQRAAELIPKRVEHFSKIMGLYPTAVKISSAKTRFGSCSAKNSLNFSFYLAMYPDEAIDYVVVHELAHIKHKNHSKQFYCLIAEFLPDYKNRIALLKK